MDAIGTQLRDPINSGLTDGVWRFHKWTPPRNSGGIPYVSTRFSLSMEMRRLTRDGTAEPVSRDQILRHTRGQGNIIFPVQLTTSKIGNLNPVDPYSAICDDHTYIHTSRGHTGGRSHRIFHPPSFCGACLNFSREKDSAIPFPRRP